MKNSIILVPVFVLAAIMAFAQERTPRVNAREAEQHARIAQGRRNGELTNGETKVLRAEQRNIRRSERRAKADGDVTARERRKLDRKQDHANHDIRRAKHNNREKN
jgi:hypothetical protein